MQTGKRIDLNKWMYWIMQRKVWLLLLMFFTIIFISYFSKSIFYINLQGNQQNSTNSFTANVDAKKPTKNALLDSNGISGNDKTLVIYIYANTHQHAFENLRYFIKNAVREGDSADYYFLLQQVGNKTFDETQLPELPKGNAFYIQKENRCFDFGSTGWFFDLYTTGHPWKNSSASTNMDENQTKRKKFSLTSYKYFIIMNASIRGPFFPPYFLQFMSDYEREFKKPFYWHYVFTKRINNKVKLVGCTINCEIIPHIQSYFIVTDFIGLTIILKPGNSGGSHAPDGIFGCYSTLQEVTHYSEFPMSNRIREAGYMIDCMLTKYQTINFSEPRNHYCNGQVNPYKDKCLNGLTLEPYEVVFVKYNDKFATTEAQERGKLYQRWREDIKTGNRSSW